MALSQTTVSFSRPADGRDRSALVGISLMMMAMLIFTVMDSIGKHLTQIYPVQQAAWGRYFFHFVITLLFLPFIGPRRLMATSQPLVQIGRGTLLAIATLCMFTAFSYLPLANAYVISFTAPLLVTALSVPLLGERVGWRRWTAIAVGFSGVLLVIRPGFGVMHWALFMPLITAFNFALYQIMTRKLSAVAGESPYAMLFYMALVGAAIQCLIVPFYWQPVAPHDWLWMIATGGLGAVGHLILIRALTLAPASVLAPFNYTQIVWAVILGWIVFADAPDAWMLAGGAVIVGSGLFVFYREARVKRA